MKVIFAIVALITFSAGETNGDEEGAKSIAAMNKKLEDLTKQLAKEKAESDANKQQLQEEQRQLHNKIGNLKDENTELRKTQAILLNAEVKLREADNELRVADSRIFEDKEKEAERKRQSAPKRQKDIESAAKKLIISEIERYVKHAAHNETTSLTKLIDSEIKRLMNQGMVETVFVGGTPGASSIYHSEYGPEKAFGPNPNPSEKYYSWTSKSSDIPAYVWYDFKRQLRPAKISFLPRQYSVANANRNSLKRFQFIGTDDSVCSKNSNWKVLCGGVSGPYQSLDDERGCTIPGTQSMQSFHCLGLRVLERENNYVALTGIRMWIYQ